MQIQGRRRRGSAKSLRAILRVPGCKSTGVMGKGIERWHPLPPDNNPGCFEALAAFSSVSIQLDENFWNKVFKEFEETEKFLHFGEVMEKESTMGKSLYSLEKRFLMSNDLQVFEIDFY